MFHVLLCNIGRFSWKSIAEFRGPFIIRLIDGEHLKFVSTRLAETHLLDNFSLFTHRFLFVMHIGEVLFFITDPEAKLLSDINHNHTDCAYGKEKFFARKDFIASLEDVYVFYTFFKVCCQKLLYNTTPDHNEIVFYI